LLLLKGNGSLGDLLRQLLGFLGLNRLGGGGEIPPATLKALEDATAKVGDEAGGLEKSRTALDGVIGELGKSAAHQHDMATVAGRFACLDCLSGWLAVNGSSDLAADMEAKVSPKLFKREAAPTA
jgi:hypothetical protein